MEKKQARHGKSGGEGSSSDRRNNKKSAKHRGRPSLHESFIWGFVDEEDDDGRSDGEDFQNPPSYGKFLSDVDWEIGPEAVEKERPAKKPASAKKNAVASNTAPSREARSAVGKMKPEADSSKPKAAKERNVPKLPKTKPETTRTAKGKSLPPPSGHKGFLFEDDFDDEDLSLPSYGRTPHSRAAGSPSPQQQEIKRSGPTAPASGKVPPKESSIAAKKPAEKKPTEKKREEQSTRTKAVPSQKTGRAPQTETVVSGETSSKEKGLTFQEQFRETERRSRSKDRPTPGLSSAPTLPPRERQRWDPKTREYVLENPPEPQRSQPSESGSSKPKGAKTESPKTASPRAESPKAESTRNLGDSKKRPEAGSERRPQEKRDSQDNRSRGEHPRRDSETAPTRRRPSADDQPTAKPQPVGKPPLTAAPDAVPTGTASGGEKSEQRERPRKKAGKKVPRSAESIAEAAAESAAAPAPRGAVPPPPMPGRTADPADAETSPTGFKKLKLSETMLESLKVARYLEPTPIQAGVIAPTMKGGDIMGQAQTGTGKTAAFLIPIIERIEECEPGEMPVAMILVPTRELAVQVRDEAVKLSYGRDIRVSACYGGKPIAKQLIRLREGVDLLVGTPGRLLDLMKRRALSCDQLRWVVLDEADRMLDIGFRPDIEKILAKTPSSRQTLLFSATLPPQVVKLAQKYMKDPEILDFSNAGVAVETIEQYYITVDHMRKFDALVALLKQEKPQQAIIFCRTKRGADRVSRMLEAQDFPSIAAIHGDLAQSVRDRVMSRFRSGSLKLLVATDVVGRGIDVSGISHIINYDIPTFCDDYVHRVGRTGRMGREGVAYTFVTAEEGSELTRIEMRIDRLLKRAELKDFEAFAKPTDSSITDPFGPAQARPVFGKPVRKVRKAL